MTFGSTAGRKREFVRLLDLEWDDCQEIAVDLREAAKNLWRNKLEDKALEAAMREVDEATKGQPFRIETSIGPLLVRQAVWRFAGRSGGKLWDDMTICGTVPRKDRPSWDGDYRPMSWAERNRIREAWRRRKNREERGVVAAAAVAA